MKKQLSLGLNVRCLDGRAGKVSKIITDPQGHQPTYLVVKRGRLHIREILVPVSLVADVTDKAVFLNLTRETLAELSEYEVTVQKGTYQKPVIAGYPRPGYISFAASNKGFMVLRQRNVPERSVAVGNGMEILDAAGRKVGTVEGIVVDARKRQGRYLLFYWATETCPRLIPSDLVQDVTAEVVRLRINKEYIDRLPVRARRAGERKHSLM